MIMIYVILFCPGSWRYFTGGCLLISDFIFDDYY